MFKFNSFENLQNDIESICGENKSGILQTVTEDNPDYVWYGEFELTIHGTIQQRAVQRRRSS